MGVGLELLRGRHLSDVKTKQNNKRGGVAVARQLRCTVGCHHLGSLGLAKGLEEGGPAAAGTIIAAVGRVPQRNRVLDAPQKHCFLPCFRTSRR